MDNEQRVRSLLYVADIGAFTHSASSAKIDAPLLLEALQDHDLSARHLAIGEKLLSLIQNDVQTLLNYAKIDLVPVGNAGKVDGEVDGDIPLAWRKTFASRAILLSALAGDNETLANASGNTALPTESRKLASSADARLNEAANQAKSLASTGNWEALLGFINARAGLETKPKGKEQVALSVIFSNALELFRVSKPSPIPLAYVGNTRRKDLPVLRK